MGELNALVEINDIEAVYMLGDFNAHPHTRFCNEMIAFCNERDWICADFEKLGMYSDSYTYISELNDSRRWLDQALVSKSAYSSVIDVSISYDVYWSDHYPLFITFNFNTIVPTVKPVNVYT